MKLSEIRVDVDKTFGKKFWLVEVAPVYDYKDGEKTDTVSGYRYVVTLPEKNFEKIGVKIPGKAVVEQVDGYAECKFAGLEAGVYQNGRDYAISAKADSIELIGSKKA